MFDKLIPPSPTDEEYERQAAANADESVFEETDPFALFARWLSEAQVREPNDAHAMALATAGGDGAPDVRMVLLKAFDPAGFSFYSNRESAKGRQIAANPQAALVFHWKTVRRQVRVRGPVEEVGPEEAEAYFASRARDARIGAWASDQSRPLESRAALEARMAELRARFEGQDPARPPYWSAWRVVPRAIEFWRDRPFRLHDRLLFERDGEGWRRSRLYP
ncbi:MAG TPA: pyridoxamine 5'-phosphate oxidase [Caulobacteraceae bacterium]|jgi:pyridoxamine 5'-phosphate oxidase